jgi:Transglycosylase SLT domain
MRRFFLLAGVLVVLPSSAGAESAAVPPGLIAGPGWGGALAGAAPARVAQGIAVGPFWRLPPPVVPPAPRQASRTPAASAAAGPGLRCQQAIASAEAAEGIPPQLLQAIGLVESGRPAPGGIGVLPWPWTIDVDGRGAFFADKAQAIAAVRAARAAGAHSIDVGCLQVSLLHHPHVFATLSDAFDPVANARFAAGFLRRLYGTTHDWAAAAAAYHSQTPALAVPYRAQVLAAWARLGGPTAPAAGPMLTEASASAAGPFLAFTPLAMAPPRQPGGFRILRAGPMGGPPPGRSLAAYRARPIPIDRGG